MRVLILAGTSVGKYERMFLEPFLASRDIKICAALINAQPRPSRFKRLVNNLKKGRGGYTVIMILQDLIHCIFKETDREDSVNYISRGHIPYWSSGDPYSNETICRIRAYNPDVLLLVNGFGIIREPLLSLCPHGVLSYHGGDMRKYRGQPSGFWELYNGESEMKVTLQRLSQGLDCGQPIIEKTIHIYKNDTLKTISERADIACADMAYNACKLLQDPSFKPATIIQFGKVYTIPNLRQWVRLQLKVLANRILQ